LTGNTATLKEMSKFSTFVLLLIPFVWTFEASAVGPVLGALAQAFPAASDLQIKLVMTSPFLTSIIFSTISGKLSDYIDKRIIVICGLLLYGISGIMPSFASSMRQILVMRVLTGIGVGLVLPLPNAIIAEHFSGEKRQRLLGWASSVANFANVLASIVCGFLLVFGWRYPFYTFGIVLVIMLLAIAGLPKSPPVRTTGQESKASTGKLPLVAYGLALFMVLNWLFCAIITTSVAIFMTKDQVGRPWMIGIAISLPGLACVVVGSIYPEVRRLLKNYFVVVSFLLFALGYLILGHAYSFIAVAIGAFLVGMGNGLLTPYTLALTANKVRPEQRDVAFGLVTAGIHIGLLCSPFLQALIVRMSYNASYRYLYMVSAMCLVVFAFFSLFFKFKDQVQAASVSP
jgi:MFS family permease